MSLPNTSVNCWDLHLSEDPLTELLSNQDITEIHVLPGSFYKKHYQKTSNVKKLNMKDKGQCH